MKAEDFIAIAEHLSKTKKRRYRQMPELDIVDLLRKKHEEAKFLEQYLKEFEKLNKKEEKKEDRRKNFTFAEGVILAIMAQMVIGPLYKVFLVHLGVQ
jgi:hypothetical protein